QDRRQAPSRRAASSARRNRPTWPSKKGVSAPARRSVAPAIENAQRNPAIVARNRGYSSTERARPAHRDRNPTLYHIRAGKLFADYGFRKWRDPLTRGAPEPASRPCREIRQSRAGKQKA